MAKDYVAGNGNFGSFDWGAKLESIMNTNATSQLKQVIDTFNNTDGSFDDKMRRTFDNLNEIEPNFNSQEALRATDPIQILMEWIEQEEKEEQDKDVVSSADEVLSQLREEQERERIRAMQDDYSQTFTNDELDQMEWRGNPNEVWSLGGKKSTRRQFVDAFKKTRDDLDKIATENNWSPDKKKYEDHLLSAAAQAAINGDLSKASDYVDHMDPKTKEKYERNLENITGNGVSKGVQQIAGVSSDAHTSTNSRAEAIESAPKANCGTDNILMGSACENVIEAKNRPTQPFNKSANPQNMEAPSITPLNNVVALEQRTEQPKTKLASLETF